MPYQISIDPSSDPGTPDHSPAVQENLDKLSTKIAASYAKTTSARDTEALDTEALMERVSNTGRLTGPELADLLLAAVERLGEVSPLSELQRELTQESTKLLGGKAGTISLSAGTIDEALEIITHSQKIATLAKVAATLSLAYECSRAGDASNLAAADGHYGQAYIEALSLVGKDHALPVLIKQAKEALPIERDSAHKCVEVGQPILKITPSGFELSFKPSEQALADRSVFIDEVIELAQEAEAVYADTLSAGSSGPYNNISSEFSSRNICGSMEARIVDPDGSYRGRASRNITGAESIRNITGRFGSTINDESPFRRLGRSNMPESWTTGVWKLVADQS